MNFTDRLTQSLRQLWAFVPGLLGAAVLLVFGYFLAKLAQRTTARVLRRIHLNKLVRSGTVIAGP